MLGIEHWDYSGMWDLLYKCSQEQCAAVLLLMASWPDDMWEQSDR